MLLLPLLLSRLCLLCWNRDLLYRFCDQHSADKNQCEIIEEVHGMSGWSIEYDYGKLEQYQDPQALLLDWHLRESYPDQAKIRDERLLEASLSWHDQRHFSVFLPSSSLGRGILRLHSDGPPTLARHGLHGDDLLQHFERADAIFPVLHRAVHRAPCEHEATLRLHALWWD